MLRSNYSRLETRPRSKMSSKIPTISKEQRMSQSKKSRLLTRRASLELLRMWLVATTRRKISLTLFSNLSLQSSNYVWRRLWNLRHPWPLPALTIRSQLSLDRPSDVRKCCQTSLTSGWTLLSKRFRSGQPHRKMCHLRRMTKTTSIILKQQSKSSVRSKMSPPLSIKLSLRARHQTSSKCLHRKRASPRHPSPAIPSWSEARAKSKKVPECDISSILSLGKFDDQFESQFAYR